MTFFSDQMPIGTRVEWKREMYRVRYANRPIDRGIVVQNDGSGYIGVKPDHAPETVVKWPCCCFQSRTVTPKPWPKGQGFFFGQNFK
jgi:hypothetical protein